MQQHEFKNYETYVGAQQAHTKRKLRRKKINCFTHQRVTSAIADDYGDGPCDLGICHGVRAGAELDLFADAFGRGRWVGTEITPELCDGKRILERDFSKPDPEWLGAIDVIYSNSFDHARDPTVTAAAWVSCLRPKSGRLYIEWTRWHEKLGVRGNKADCFAATADECRTLLASVGCVERVLILRGFRARKDGQRYQRKIFVVSRKDNQ